jgi:CHAT domain-containing protein
LDTDLFLQNLRDLSLEEGKAHIQEHIAELTDHVVIAKLLDDEALRLLYAPFISLKIAELLIFYGEYVEDGLSHALGLKAKGDALAQIGHYEAALESLDLGGEEFLSLGDKKNWARSRLSWVFSAGYLGRIDDALQTAEQARIVFSQLGELYWVGAINNNAALVYEFIGRYKDAIKFHEEMLANYSSVTNQIEPDIRRSIAITQINLARNVSMIGDIDRAYKLLQQAQISFSALEETALSNIVEYEIANLDYLQGYYTSAFQHYYLALDNMLEENPVFLAELKLNIANCLIKLSRTQEACVVSGEAVKIYRQSGLSLNTGIALSEYAKALVAANRLNEAIGSLDEASDLFNRGGFEPFAFANRLQQAEIFLQMEAFTQAYTQAQEVKWYYDDQGFVIRSIQASLIMADVLIANVRHNLHQQTEGQSQLLQEAMSLCRKIISQARSHNLQEEIAKSHYLLGGIYALQDNLSLAAKHYGAAIAQIERILDELAFDLSPSFIHATWAVYEDMIALHLQQSRPELAFYYLEQARSMALRQHLSRSTKAIQRDKLAGNTISPTILRTQYELRDWQEQHRKYSMLVAEIDRTGSLNLNRETIVNELKRCEEKINELFERLYIYEAIAPLSSRAQRTRKAGHSEHASKGVQRIDITQVRQHLAGDHLLLSYYMHGDKLVIFAITKEHLKVHELPGGRIELEKLLLMLHANFQAQGWFGTSGSQKTIRRLLTKLYDLLITPVASLLPSKSGYLTIVPYDSLHTLPFHSLYNGSHYLIEDYQVNYLPASSLLTHFDLRNSQLNDPVETVVRPLLVLGYSDQGHLPRVLEEARTITSLLGGDCYLEKEATIAKLIQQAPTSSIIHLATHGQNRLDAPNFSYVHLADGPLNAIDAFGLDLRYCELVVLSGCETGLALSGGGDEQLGLARAFLAAGAPSLVISLWSVEDSSTNELMQQFYQHLQQGESKAQALRSAQCNLLQRTDSMYAHPYFWAAFRLVGDVGPLKCLANQKSNIALMPEISASKK